jgi:quercetin dioxygenase-like cupin family protein
MYNISSVKVGAREGRARTRRKRTHHVTHLVVDETPPGMDDGGPRRQPLIGAEQGSVHLGMSQLTLWPRGSCSGRRHRFEQSFFVLAGTLVVALVGREVSLGAGDAIRLPVGTTYALRNDSSEPARWIETAAPQPRDDPGLPPDTFVLDPGAPWPLLPDEGDAAVVVRAAGAKPGERLPRRVTIEGIDGLGLEMLVEQSLGLHSLFVVDAKPGFCRGPHDHPLEETYLMLEGSCRWTFDGKPYLLSAGDVAWAGVGTIHSVHSVTEEGCRWLEAQAPMPSSRHTTRDF